MSLKQLKIIVLYAFGGLIDLDWGVLSLFNA